VAEEVEILLVEDNPADAELALRALKKAGLLCPVRLAREGEEALDFIFARGRFAGREAGRGVRAIILDLKLPKVDGLEVLKAVKGDPRTRGIPVVMLTSSRVPADIEACYRAGANSYVVKPVDYAAHAQVLKELGLYWAQHNVAAGG
jgi:CheY-like chemotaxis protein